MIETQRLKLRPWRETDAEALYKYAGSPDVGPVAGWPVHTSVENSLEIIRTVFASPEIYAIVLKETDEPVGSCGIMFDNSLHSADMQQQEAEIGYWIGKPHWGQGLVPEAVKALLKRCFNELGLTTVWCGHYEGNNKSKRVCEKCGFRYHHTNHDVVSPLGDKRTEHFYKMTREDYTSRYIDPTDMKLNYTLPDIPQEYQSFLSAALTMAERAGDIHMKYFRSRNLEQSTKLNDSDVVTIADKQSEAAILNFIRTRFPLHGIISEESGRDHEEREWRWVIDPLDGTTNFSAGLPAFCVSIALEHNKEAVVGVVYLPYLRECFYAVRGAGAWFNGNPIHCSDKAELSKAVVATGMPYDRNENSDNNLAEICRMALRVRGVRRMGSAAIDLCYTAAGYFDAYWELNLNRWDVAAGELIASEAGAVIEAIRTDRNHSILASNPNLHPAIRQILLEK